MCESKAQGGRRCAGYHQDRIKKLGRQVVDAPDAEKKELEARLTEAKQEYLTTRSGVQDFITSEDSSPEDVVRVTKDYIDSHPGRAILDLPGGRYRVTDAEMSQNQVLFTIEGRKSLETYSDQLDQCFYGQNPAGRQVTQVSPKDLKSDYSTLMISCDGRAGGGVKKNGEIAGIFSNSTLRGTAHSIVTSATHKGGRYLECFDTYLPKVYAKSGFVKVSSIDFNREYAPEGWDYKAMNQYNNGEPPIVMMMSPSHYEKHEKPEFKEFGSADDAWDKATDYARR